MYIFDGHNHIGKRPGASQETSEIIEAMDMAGVQRAIVFPFPEFPDNDYVIDAVKDFPDRLVGFACINPWDKKAVEELRRCAESGLKGLKLHPMRHGYGVDKHSIVDPVFSVCTDYKWHVVVHCTSDNPFTMPFQVEEAARTFPEVTFQMAHMGYMWAVDQALLVAGRNENAYLETSAAGVLAIKKAVEQVGAHKVIMGTDSPFHPFELEQHKIKIAIPEPASRELVLGKNLLNLLGIS